MMIKNDDNFLKIPEEKLVEEWKQNNNKQAFNHLLNLYKPVIIKKTNELRTHYIPDDVLMATVEQNVAESFKRYDSSRKNKLFTFVNSRLPEVNHFVYKYQNAGRIPIHRTTSYSSFTTVLDELRQKLNKEPSDFQLADKLKWPIKEVERMRSELRKDISEFNLPETPTFSEFGENDDEFLFLLYYELNDKEKEVYNRLFGKNGYKKTDLYSQIAKDMNLSNSMITKIRNNIAKKARKFKR